MNARKLLIRLILLYTNFNLKVARYPSVLLLRRLLRFRRKKRRRSRGRRISRSRVKARQAP